MPSNEIREPRLRLLYPVEKLGLRACGNHVVKVRFNVG